MRSVRLLMVLFELGIVFILTIAPASSANVQSSIFKTLEEKQTVNILVSFKSSEIQLAAVRDAAATQSAASKAGRITAMYTALKVHAASAQANVIKMLKRKKSSHAEFISFWITNQVGIRQADLTIVEELLAMEEVSEVTKEQTFKIELQHENFKTMSKPLVEVQWGIDAIAAPEVWAREYKGLGVVVAGIDSGVQGTHEALRDGFREDHGWYDPINRTHLPTDVNGHGTHTMGTIVGRIKGIGVAPEAQWIACRAGYDDATIDYFNFLSCGQFVFCPTDPSGDNEDCGLAPDIVNNSWGSDEDIPNYNEIISAWTKAGIIPVFAAGNSGPRCSTVGSPGTHPDVISVGSISRGNRVSEFSSRGPSRYYGSIQPDVAAPGEKILSAWPSPNSDEEYRELSGTSMAAPHLAGLLALLKSSKKDLTFAQIRRLITEGVKPVISVSQVCDGNPDSGYPNNFVGHGRINATLALEAIEHLAPSSETMIGINAQLIVLLVATFYSGKIVMF